MPNPFSGRLKLQPMRFVAHLVKQAELQHGSMLAKHRKENAFTVPASAQTGCITRQ